MKVHLSKSLRLSDVKKQRWADIRDRHLDIDVKKTGEPLSLPLNDFALSLHGTRTDGIDPIFDLSSSDWSTWDRIHKWARAAGITKAISFHVSRRTFATLLLTYGKDRYTVSKLFGHAEVKNTQLYLTLVDRTKEQAIEGYPRFDLKVQDRKIFFSAGRQVVKFNHGS